MGHVGVRGGDGIKKNPDGMRPILLSANDTTLKDARLAILQPAQSYFEYALQFSAGNNRDYQTRMS